MTDADTPAITPRTTAGRALLDYVSPVVRYEVPGSEENVASWRRDAVKRILAIEAEASAEPSALSEEDRAGLVERSRQAMMAARGHVHQGAWCPRCVAHGQETEAEPGALRSAATDAFMRLFPASEGGPSYESDRLYHRLGEALGVFADSEEIVREAEPAALRAALEQTAELPEDAPPSGIKADWYAAGWGDRGDAVRAALSATQDGTPAGLDDPECECGEPKSAGIHDAVRTWVRNPDALHAFRAALSTSERPPSENVAKPRREDKG